MHNAWRILRKASTALLYMPGLKMVDYPPYTCYNRDFRGLSSASSPKFFQSLTSRVLAVRLARASNSIAALLVFGLVLTQVMWWQVIVFSLKASHVQDTLEFDKHLHASSKETMPHLRHNLPGERLETMHCAPSFLLFASSKGMLYHAERSSGP